MNNRDRVREKIAEILGHPTDKIVDEAVLTDLVTSSFLLVGMIIELQEEFDILFQQADMNIVSTVGELLELADSRMTESSAD